jgi:hypothetical protein
MFLRSSLSVGIANYLLNVSPEALGLAVAVGVGVTVGLVVPVGVPYPPPPLPDSVGKKPPSVRPKVLYEAVLLVWRTLQATPPLNSQSALAAAFADGSYLPQPVPQAPVTSIANDA